MPVKELKQFPLEEEYKKNTGITPEDINVLRSWMNTQPHLPSKYITDLDLILTLYSCDCSTGVAKQVLDLHYTLRTLFTAYFKDRHFDAGIQKALDTILMTPLPTRTKEGYAIFYVNFLDYDPKNFNFPDSIKAILMITDLWQYNEGTWPGFVLVVNFNGISLGHLVRFDILNVQKYLYYLQEAMLVRLKGLHFINAPSFIDKFMTLITPFMKKELLDILGIHPPGAKSLENCMPLEALPKEAGGKYKSFQECNEDVIKMIRAGEVYLQNENLKRVSESLRPGKPKSIVNIFEGMEGSFKKLDID